MGHPQIQVWTWTLCVFLSWMCVGQVVAGPHYMVAIPAVIEAGAETKFCASLLQPNETMVMTVTLMSEEKNTTLLKQTASEEFHTCTHFQAPEVQIQDVQKFEVEVRGDTFYSKEVRKVMVKVYKPATFVQTDKPIYLPGQTVHFRVITLDNKFRPASRLYSSIEIEDVNSNLIGQWQNKTSDSKILQLSYSLNSEAREGLYQIIVSFDDSKIRHAFKVEKYVLPKFDVKMETSEEVSIEQEQVQVEVCAKYTYGQPVPGQVEVEMCRPLSRYTETLIVNTPEHPEGIPEVTAPCFKETKQTDRKGCATFTVPMSTFTKIDQKALRDNLRLKATVQEEGTGVSRLQEKRIRMTYVIGKLSFIDTPKIYHQGENMEGKVKAVRHDDTPIADMKLYLFEGERWSNRLLSNLTTDKNGVASFSVSTESFRGDVQLHIHSEPTLGYSGYRTPHYETGRLTVSLAQASTVDTKSVSSLEVKTKDGPLPCDKEEEIFIHYTVVGEKQGSVHVMYLVLSRGVIVMQGFKQIEVQDQPVNEGEVSFKLTVTPDMAPHIQVLAYAVLPSETVMAHSADFSTEKCFGHKVSLEFSPSSAVPGEETTMQLTTQPDSLCGVSAVDQSVLIKEPGKTLTAEKIFNLLPVTKASYIPYEVQDPVDCLHVRPRRYIMPHPSERDDAYTVFRNVGMKMATNLFIRIPSCLMFRGREYHQGHHGMRTRLYSAPEMARMGVAGPSGPGGHPDLPIIETVR
ncbi:hypothetical protein INR49_016233, partial [Caranx melampygus]